MRRPLLKVLDQALDAKRHQRAMALRAERLRPVTDEELRERFRVSPGGTIYRHGFCKPLNLSHPRGWLLVRGHRVTFDRLRSVLCTSIA
jgi:hypothetical protein